jgi:TRAP-type transport system small permease protein
MRYLKRPVNWLVASALLVLVGITNYGVFMRYVMGQPVHWGEEMSALLLIWIVMVGAIAAERDGQHLTISVFTDILPEGVRRGLELAVTLASAVLLFYLAWLGWQLAMSTQFRVTAILRIPQMYLNLALPVGFAGTGLYMLHAAYAGMTRPRAGDDR